MKVTGEAGKLQEAKAENDRDALKRAFAVLDPDQQETARKLLDERGISAPGAEKKAPARERRRRRPARALSGRSAPGARDAAPPPARHRPRTRVKPRPSGRAPARLEHHAAAANFLSVPRRLRRLSRTRRVTDVGDINLEVWDATGNKRLEVRVPDDVTVDRILIVLADKLHLPQVRA